MIGRAKGSPIVSLAFGVFCWKSNNTLIRYQSYATRTAAQEVVEALAKVGCSAMIIVDDGQEAPK